MKEDKRKMYCILRFQKKGYGAAIIVKMCTYREATDLKKEFTKKTGDRFLYYIDTNVSDKEEIGRSY